MQSNVYVTASGPALSLLLYENTKAPGYQIGFLLGAVVNQVTDTISDSQIRGEKTETIINISSILPIPSSSHAFNGAGIINWEKIAEIVESEKKLQQLSDSQSHDIVGWYSFKRNVTPKLSMREHIIHQQFAERARVLSQGTSPELFVLCLLYNNLMSKATHVFKHSFMRYLNERKSFELIPLQIHNLGMSQSSQYQITACAPSTASMLRTLFDQIGSSRSGGDLMLEVQSKLQILLNQRIQDLDRVERRRERLEQEVKDLKIQLESKLKNHQITRTPPTQMEMNVATSANFKTQFQSHTNKQNRPSYLNFSHAEPNPEQNSEKGESSEAQLEDICEPTSPIFTPKPRNRPKRSDSPENFRRFPS